MAALQPCISSVFFFNDTATTEIYTLSLHDALPIYRGGLPELRMERTARLRPQIRRPVRKDARQNAAIRRRSRRQSVVRRQAHPGRCRIAHRSDALVGRQEHSMPEIGVRKNVPDIRAQFIDGMSRAATCVSVVTTDGPAGRFGVTVSAMSSISADGEHPTVLICVHHQSRSAAAIIENGTFCINVLRDDQSSIADCFADRIRRADGDKFGCARWVRESTGAPRLADPLAAFDCRVLSTERVGTHHIFIGAVETVVTAGPGAALIYADRAYGTTQRIEAPRPKTAGARPQ